MTREEFSRISSTIPQNPGCYKYYSAEAELLYVGKAKNLKKRISSYFNKTIDSVKTKRLVAQIHHIEFTITESEHDAFLLENSLIKHYQPKYNISLKDDKTYPYIVIKKENFPRVFLTRRLIRDGSEYIGPFTSVASVYELLELVRQNIPLRTCNLNLTPQNIEKGKFKVCLEYHLGNCKGPCEGLQNAEDYAENLRQVRHILKGNIGEVLKYLKAEMMQLASELKFEKAAVIKNKIDILQQYESKSTVVNPHLGNIDVASIISGEDYAFVNYMMVNMGSVIYDKSIQVEKKMEEEDAEILALALAKLRETYHSNAREIIVPFPIDVVDQSIKITVPKVGDKKKLLEMSMKNAQVFQSDLRKKATLLIGEHTQEQAMKVLEELQDALQLPDLPVHIECFDNSNFQGSYPVSAMVCFRNGMPSNKDYRHYNVKTVEGINDFATMSEVVYRRYKRLMDEHKPLPQLVIIDGGKGQLSAALQSIEKLGLTGRMTLVGLAKREESIFFPGDSVPLQLPYDNEAHKLIRRIRDEVHRFGITFHRKIRSRGTIKNELESIPGIGQKTATELLTAFRSVNKIKSLTQREIAAEIGTAKARIVWNYFHADDTDAPVAE